MLSYSFVFLIGISTGFLDAVIGCGGLISIPMLIFTGMPAHVAVATDRFGSLGSALTASIRYYKSNQIVVKHLLFLSILAVLGAFIGASLLLEIDQALLEKGIGYLLIVLLPVVFLKKDLGLKNRQTQLILITIGYFIFFLFEIYSGFIGIASGIFTLLILNFFLGLDFLKANATMQLVSLLSIIVALLVFANNGVVDYISGFILLVSMSIGAYLGASLAIKGGSKLIRYFFVIIVLLSSTKIIFPI